MPVDGAGSRLSSYVEGITWYETDTGGKGGHELICQGLTHVTAAPRNHRFSYLRSLLGSSAGVGQRIGTAWTMPAYADNGEAGSPGRGPASLGDVEVLCRAPTGSPTATATSQPPATPTTTPTPTASPNPTSTALPEPIYLPINIREEGCVPGGSHTDVAIVVDTSTSMQELTRAGRPKIDAAVEAATLFLGELDMAGGDQATIVQFNGSGTVLQELTDDAGALLAALAQVTMGQQTRIHVGLELATAELMSTRHRTQNAAATILLTDGRNNPEPVALAVAQAELARRAGIRVFTIGLGSDLDLEALELMASTPAGFYLAPDGEDLAEIYAQIAEVIPCPPREYWPGWLWP
jgi:hypothetical protein